MRKKMLLVDDESSILKILEYFFNPKYDVVIKSNAREAMMWLQQGNMPDMIIADYKMPGLDGGEFIRHVRASGLFSDIPLIILSAQEDTATKIKCLRAGADDYMLKPFNPEEVEARVDNIFRRMKV